jgi:hypothetical protein
MGNNGLILWVLGGTGVLFIYAAYKNQTPQSVLLNHLGQNVPNTPIAATSPAQRSGHSGLTPGATVGGGGGGGGGGGVVYTAPPAFTPSGRNYDAGYTTIPAARVNNA